ncbi:MAG TPA: DNA mismatch repair endonuclease MutL [Ktedonobacterales bacterium]|nr:DNA mismatch repair endonuclease MutL [Ktedonobacterales bacterium]
MPIRQLPADVAAKIAAGEVVERPASVVKELVENAIDAGASFIRVDLQGGGLDLIRVVDDGRGIAADELALAFSRHATSKIGSLDDLERIRTLGFRGEALASIAAVAQVTLVSRARDAAVGAQAQVAGGVVAPVTPAGAPVGTSVTVRALFAEVPARLKVLKTRATETGHCLNLLEQFALAYPEIRFSAQSEGRPAFITPGDGSLRSSLVAVYGVRIADDMVPFGEPQDADGAGPEAAPPEVRAGDEPRPRVGGYVSRPTTYKGTRHAISLFVNRRWVQSRTLTYAVEEAYHTLLLAGRHPIAVVNVEIDPAQLDVNVHPAKTEVRFLRERQVYATVQRAVRAAVLAQAETPEIVPGAFTVPADSDHLSAWLGATVVPPQAPLFDRPPDTLAAADNQSPLWERGAADSEREAPAEGLPPRGAAAGFAVPGEADEGLVGGDRLPVLRVLGQVSQAYIITEGPNGVYMVDQHAAHERILLERMVHDWRGRAASSQLLLEPLPLELAPSEREAIEAHLERLAGIGFTIEPFGDAALLLRAVPAALAAQARPRSLQELLLELAGGDDVAERHGETWEEHALANVACKAAIKAGQTLSPEEQRALIRQLEGAEGRQSCCHGRPTMVHLSLDALERQFDRR